MAWWYVDEIDNERKMIGPFDTYDEARSLDDGSDDVDLIELPDGAPGNS